jgi:hypothetical protein
MIGTIFSVEDVPKPQGPSKQMLFLVKIHRDSGSCWIRFCCAKFERCIVKDGVSIPTSPNSISPVASFGGIRIDPTYRSGSKY